MCELTFFQSKLPYCFVCFSRSPFGLPGYLALTISKTAAVLSDTNFSISIFSSCFVAVKAVTFFSSSTSHLCLYIRPFGRVI